MEKKQVIIGIIVFVLLISLCGCQERKSQGGNQTTNLTNGNYNGNNTNGNQQHNTTDNAFLGDWEVIDVAPNYETWSFYANGSAKDYLIQEFEDETYISISWFEYTKDNTTLCFSSMNESPDSPNYISICYTYLFSQNATRLTFYSQGIVIIDLERISSKVA